MFYHRPDSNYVRILETVCHNYSHCHCSRRAALDHVWQIGEAVPQSPLMETGRLRAECGPRAVVCRRLSQADTLCGGAQLGEPSLTADSLGCPRACVGVGWRRQSLLHSLSVSRLFVFGSIQSGCLLAAPPETLPRPTQASGSSVLAVLPGYNHE